MLTLIIVDRTYDPPRFKVADTTEAQAIIKAWPVIHPGPPTDLKFRLANRGEDAINIAEHDHRSIPTNVLVDGAHRCCEWIVEWILRTSKDANAIAVARSNRDEFIQRYEAEQRAEKRSEDLEVRNHTIPLSTPLEDAVTRDIAAKVDREILATAEGPMIKKREMKAEDVEQHVTEIFDDWVHEEKSQEASRINNNGIPAQLEFLAPTAEREDLERDLAERLQGRGWPQQQAKDLACMVMSDSQFTVHDVKKLLGRSHGEERQKQMDGDTLPF